MESPEGVSAVRNHLSEGDGTCRTVNARPGNARTFLVHMFGHGLEDDRYVVERFKSMTERRHPSPER